MDRLRIGMIGCGEIAVRVAAAIASSRHAQHVMVMDTRAALARDLGEQYGVHWTDDIDGLLANPAVDAVYIAVPHHLHAPLTIRAAAGKHVLVEKPIATTLADAEAMIAAARANGVWLSVNFHAQVDPLCRAARNLVAQGAIGEVVGTRIVFRGDKPASYWASGYSGRAPAAGGCVKKPVTRQKALTPTPLPVRTHRGRYCGSVATSGVTNPSPVTP